MGLVFQAGIISGEHGELWLEPIATELSEKARDDARSSNILPSKMAQPHLLFRRSAGQLEPATDTNKRRLKKRKKKKKKKKHERNCGTRGENR